MWCADALADEENLFKVWHKLDEELQESEVEKSTLVATKFVEKVILRFQGVEFVCVVLCFECSIQ